MGSGAESRKPRNFTPTDVKSSIVITTQLIFLLIILRQSEPKKTYCVLQYIGENAGGNAGQDGCAHELEFLC